MEGGEFDVRKPPGKPPVGAAVVKVVSLGLME
jgi:hypothetical protein